MGGVKRRGEEKEEAGEEKEDEKGEGGRGHRGTGGQKAPAVTHLAADAVLRRQFAADAQTISLPPSRG